MFVKLEYTPDAVDPTVVELIECSPALESIFMQKTTNER